MRYEVKGTPFPVVVCYLDNQESMISEGGSMAWMSPNMHMETTSNGGVGKMIGRAFSGEKMFQNIYTAMGGNGMIAFASSFPGEIRAVNIQPGHELVVTKSGFLASEQSVDMSVFFQKKLGVGIFGGEGFIMQRLSGSGMAFLEIDGTAIDYDLAPGQQIIVDTGYVICMDATCSIDVKTVPGVKNMLFGGEGIFNTVVTGPGRVTIQTQPISNVAAQMRRFLPGR